MRSSCAAPLQPSCYHLLPVFKAGPVHIKSSWSCHDSSSWSTSQSSCFLLDFQTTYSRGVWTDSVLQGSE